MGPSYYEAVPYIGMIVGAGLGSEEPRIGMAPFITRSVYDLGERGTCRRPELVNEFQLSLQAHSAREAYNSTRLSDPRTYSFRAKVVLEVWGQI